jgi:hypothetical protein
MYQNYKKYHIKLLFFVKNYICSNFELSKNQKYQEYEKKGTDSGNSSSIK